jgi:hypothetical protein
MRGPGVSLPAKAASAGVAGARRSCGRRCPCRQVRARCAAVPCSRALRQPQTSPAAPTVCHAGRRIAIQSSSRAGALCVRVRLWEAPGLESRRRGAYVLLTAPLVLTSQVRPRASSCAPMHMLARARTDAACARMPSVRACTRRVRIPATARPHAFPDASDMRLNWHAPRHLERANT